LITSRLQQLQRARSCARRSTARRRAVRRRRGLLLPLLLERASLAAAYADEHLGAQNAAAQGYVDEVIEPSETRDRLAAALALLERTPEGAARAGNVPL
jgi:acetyl-CoA carboxylase carboxyltransferase component